MINYLSDFNISIEELELIEENLSKDLVLNFKLMQDNVVEVLTYLKEIGVKKLGNVILHRPDLCFMTFIDLQTNFKKIDISMLVHIIDNSIDDLICFNI